MSADTGRRAGHGVGQPDVQRQLGRLADRAEEEQQRDRRGGARSDARGGRADVEVVDRSDGHEHQERAEHEPDVADAVGDERLLARRGVRGVGVPERDEQVGARPHALPAEEGQHQVVAEHQQQHRGDEQVEVHEELGELRVPLHVADRVEVDQRADPGDEQAHQDRQRIGQEADVHLEAARGDPGEEHLVELPLLLGQGEHVEVHLGGDQEAGAHHGRGEHTGTGVAQAATGDDQRDEADERQHGDEPDQVHELSPSSTRCRRRPRPGVVA